MVFRCAGFTAPLQPDCILLGKVHMRMNSFTVDDVTVIRVHGHVDRTSAGTLREGVCAALLRLGRGVVVNLDYVERIDAAGLGGLADIRQTGTTLGVRIAITNVQPRVREMLDVSALTASFPIASSECDAIEDADLCVSY
jgi:anti-anti-sigma factor